MSPRKGNSPARSPLLPGRSEDQCRPPANTITAASVTPRRTTTAYVSLYAPAGRRKWWWYSYRCATCGTYQLGRARELEDVTGERRAGCGHLVSIVIARTYGTPESAA
jgi:hypothetical protein